MVNSTAAHLEPARKKRPAGLARPAGLYQFNLVVFLERFGRTRACESIMSQSNRNHSSTTSLQHKDRLHNLGDSKNVSFKNRKNP
jgi:hypothetical protein